MSIAMVSVCTREIYDFAQYAFTVNEAYCKRHGIDFYGHVQSLDPSRPANWSKIPAILPHIGKAEWIIWIDADALVANHDLKFDQFFNITDRTIIMGKDRNGWNSGVFMIRGNERAGVFLNWVYNQTQYIGKRWEEQAAMMFGFDTIFQDDVFEIDRNLFNAYLNSKSSRCYQRGDFVLHAVNEPRHRRIEVFKQIHDRIMEGKNAIY